MLDADDGAGWEFLELLMTAPSGLAKAPQSAGDAVPALRSAEGFKAHRFLQVFSALFMVVAVDCNLRWTEYLLLLPRYLQCCLRSLAPSSLLAFGCGSIETFWATQIKAQDIERAARGISGEEERPKLFGIFEW